MAGLKLLKLMGFVWTRWELYFGLVQRPFPPQWVYLVSLPEPRRSLRAVEPTRRNNWAPGCSPQKCWGECECGHVSSCGACRSSWSCVGRQRRLAPGTRASCSSLRWSAPQIPPDGRRRSPTSSIRPGRPDGPLTYCPPPHARHLPRYDLPASASSSAPTECSVPGEGKVDRKKRDVRRHDIMLLVHHNGGEMIFCDHNQKADDAKRRWNGMENQKFTHMQQQTCQKRCFTYCISPQHKIRGQASDGPRAGFLWATAQGPWPNKNQSTWCLHTSILIFFICV